MSKHPPPALGWLAMLTFSWVARPIRQARKGEQLKLDELYLPEEHTTEALFPGFQAAWAAQSKRESRPLLRVLLRTYGRAFFAGGLCKLAWSALVITGAFYFVRSLLFHVQRRAPYAEGWKGYVLSAFFFVFAALWGEQGRGRGAGREARG